MRRRSRQVKLYGREDDHDCARVRAHLEACGITFEVRDVPERPEERRELLDLSGQRRIPVLVDGEILVIGTNEVLAYVERAFVSVPIP